MPDVSLENLLVVCALAVLAPLVVGFWPQLRVPAVVLEIVAGIIVGPAVLGWVRVDLPLQILALLGLAFLLFLAGLEIDLHRLRGRVLSAAVLGYLATLVLGLGAGAAFAAAGWVAQPLLLAIALSATSLGLVVPVLKDAGQLAGGSGRVGVGPVGIGQSVIAAATVADFAAIVLLSLLFSSATGSTGSRLVLLTAFATLVLATAAAGLAAGHWRRLGEVLVRLQDSTAEIRVRLAVVLLVALTVLAEHFGLESILGAFLAGALVGLLDRDTASHPHFRTKLEAIGFGFLVPVFFVTSGIRLDLTGLVEDPAALLRVPLLLLALLLVRGVPALLDLRAHGPRPTVAVALLQATSLPFLVTTAQIGIELGMIAPVTGAALVLAGLVSVLMFPLLALGLLRPATPTLAPTAAAAPRSAAPVAPVSGQR
jgi:Kef-type K+ transport system membrane component KefB